MNAYVVRFPSSGRRTAPHTQVVVGSRARWHHYVPKLHLKLFAEHPDSAFIYEHDKRTDRTWRRAIRTVAAEMDYYTVAGPDGRPSDALEQSFGRIESQAAPVLRRLAGLPAGTLAITEADRLPLAAYIALQHARGPSELEPNRQLAEFFGSAVMDMLHATPDHYRDFDRRYMGSTATDEELEAERVAGLERLRSGAWKVPGSRELALSAVRTEVDAITPIVASMHWTLLRRTRPPWFVLGDTPVMFFKGRRIAAVGIGFATDGVEVHMPVDPTHTFVATATNSPLAERVVDFHGQEASAAMNVESWAYAVGAVYGHTAEAIDTARQATPEALRGYREPLTHIDGGPTEWDRYKPRMQGRANRQSP